MQRQTRRARVGRVTLCFPQCNCSFQIGSEGPHVVSKSSNFTDGSVLTDSKRETDLLSCLYKLTRSDLNPHLFLTTNCFVAA